MDLAMHFYDIHEMNTGDQETIRQMFVGSLAQFIVDHIERFGDAVAIARSVYDRMCGTHLHYHTPIHIIQMFCFAETHDIQLEPWEELALWWHDAIYWPGTGFGASEEASAEFMKASLPPFRDINGGNGIKPPKYNLLVGRAANCIKATKKHLDDDVDQMYHKVFDLDVNTFLATGNMLREINDCLKKELCPNSDKNWMQGRMNFLERLTAKGHIFRSQEMLRFNKQAMANVTEQIEECRRYLNG